MNALHVLEESFDFDAVMLVHKAHVEVPIFAICAYLLVIFWLPDKIAQPYNLKAAMAVWNLALSVFSIVGATRLVPVLFHQVSTGGMVSSMCSHSASELKGGAGLFMMLFIYSKFFELLDTVFLVLHKRPVIFLHWFHHVTVLLYCWMSYGEATSTGLWFASMNYMVHSIMYFYYFLMIFRSLRPVVRVFAPIITSVQITQMVGGLVVSATAGYMHQIEGPESCDVPPSNWKLGGAMYLSYFFLFAMLFFEKFIAPRKAKGGKETTVCNATDSAGMFRGDSHSTRAKKD